MMKQKKEKEQSKQQQQQPIDDIKAVIIKTEFNPTPIVFNPMIEAIKLDRRYINPNRCCDALYTNER